MSGITRRWVLGGLVAAPAVLIKGQFMPAPAPLPRFPNYDFPLIDLNLANVQMSGDMLDKWAAVYGVKRMPATSTVIEMANGYIVVPETDRQLRDRLLRHIYEHAS